MTYDCVTPFIERVIPMRQLCRAGRFLFRDFDKAIKHRGCLEADLQAAQNIPIGIVRLREIAQAARQAERELIKARHAYVEHMTECIKCSGHIVLSQKK